MGRKWGPTNIDLKRRGSGAVQGSPPPGQGGLDSTAADISASIAALPDLSVGQRLVEERETKRSNKQVAERV